MSDEVRCPQCGSADLLFRARRAEYVCEACSHVFQPAAAAAQSRRIFLSYGRAEQALAERIYQDLRARGHDVWFDRVELQTGSDWAHRIEEGLETVRTATPAGCVVLLMTPYSVRRPDGYCLNEIARAVDLRVEIIPVMVETCIQPMSIYRLQYLDMRDCIPAAERTERYEQQLERLVRCVSGEVRLEGEGGQARLMACLRPISFNADLQHYVPGFTGRAWLFEAVDRWLRDPGASRVFWITGDPGVGKTAIATALQTRRPEVAAFHLCRFHDSEKADPRRCVLSVAYQLTMQLDEYRRRLLELPLESIVESASAETLFDRLIVQPLWSDYPAPERPVVLLIDALDEATRGGRNELAEFIARQMSNTPPWLRFIITSRPEVEVLATLSSFNPLVIDAASAHNVEDLRAYIHQRLAPLNASGADLSSAIDAIVERSAGNFLYATWVCEEITAGRLSLQKPTEFPRGLTGIYLSAFRRQFPEAGAYKTTIRPALQLIAAAREPLETKLVVEHLNWSEQDTEDFRQTVGALFPERDGSLRPFHRSVMEWLTDRDLSGIYFVSEQAGHKTLAGFGWAAFKRRDLSPYFARHLAFHLAEIEDWERLEEVLSDRDLFMQHSGWTGRYAWMGLWRKLNDGKKAPERYAATLNALEESGEAPESIAGIADRIGGFLDEMGQHAQAHPFIERALRWRQSHLGDSHPDVAASLHRLAECLRREQRFDEARPLYDRAIALYRAAGPQGQADVADTLHDLGELHHDLAQVRHDPQEYIEAQRAYEEALTVQEQLLDPDDPAIARSVNDLAALHYECGRHDTAMPLFERAERIFRRALGPSHLEVAVAQFGQARIYSAKGDLSRAWSLFLHALESHERMLPSGHAKVNTCRVAIRGMLFKLAPDACRQAAIELVGARERVYGRSHPETLASGDFAVALVDRGAWGLVSTDLPGALKLAQQGLALCERIHGSGHLLTAYPMTTVVRCLQMLEQFGAALGPAKRALEIREQAADVPPVDLATALNNYGLLLVELKQFEEAEAALRRCLVVQADAPFANYWLGVLYERRGRTTDIPLEVAAWQAFLATGAPHPGRRKQATERLAKLGLV